VTRAPFGLGLEIANCRALLCGLVHTGPDGGVGVGIAHAGPVSQKDASGCLTQGQFPPDPVRHQHLTIARASPTC
jgi:hypothetical protein